MATTPMEITKPVPMATETSNNMTGVVLTPTVKSIPTMMSTSSCVGQTSTIVKSEPMKIEQPQLKPPPKTDEIKIEIIKPAGEKKIENAVPVSSIQKDLKNDPTVSLKMTEEKKHEVRQHITILCEMGFKIENVMSALAVASYNFDLALEFLLSHQIDAKILIPKLLRDHKDVRAIIVKGYYELYLQNNITIENNYGTYDMKTDQKIVGPMMILNINGNRVPIKPLQHDGVLERAIYVEGLLLEILETKDKRSRELLRELLKHLVEREPTLIPHFISYQNYFNYEPMPFICDDREMNKIEKPINDIKAFIEFYTQVEYLYTIFGYDKDYIRTKLLENGRDYVITANQFCLEYNPEIEKETR
jgi:hypothetical protein